MAYETKHCMGTIIGVVIEQFSCYWLDVKFHSIRIINGISKTSKSKVSDRWSKEAAFHLYHVWLTCVFIDVRHKSYRNKILLKYTKMICHYRPYGAFIVMVGHYKTCRSWDQPNRFFLNYCTFTGGDQIIDALQRCLSQYIYQIIVLLISSPKFTWCLFV